ncbi:MAG: D-alanyl-D-alanine carboxypeptidase [Clostridia bacterium]|nr:D-alanyl-D-alanine carboxypeptidase [Clostridia bacterium]
MKKKITALFLIITLFFNAAAVTFGANAEGKNVGVSVASAPAQNVDLGLDCKGAVLMEAETGEILYEQNADEALPPASVTKIMTLLLVMEALDAGVLTYDTELSASENASSMGGSQIFLEPGERMTVRDLIKSVVISSANDAAVVLAEAVGGSENAFVTMMNKRAAELGMKTAHFENTNGLDDTVTNHVLSALDIAIMSRELIKHKEILTFSSTWMDSVRDGAFGLSNTNRLIRSYNGANGLKTGSTSKAGFCISATATRDGMTLIAVIMASPTRDTRNAAAASLLDFGFANYSLYHYEAGESGEVAVPGGKERICHTGYDDFYAVVPKGKAGKVVVECELTEKIPAPVKSGDRAGSIKFVLDGENIGESVITVKEDIPRLSYGELLWRMIKYYCII